MAGVLLGRQRFAMALVRGAPAPVTPARLLRWLFLAAEGGGARALMPFYDFLRTEQGLVSFTFEHELARLLALGRLALRRGRLVAVDRAPDPRLPARAARLAEEVLASSGGPDEDPPRAPAPAPLAVYTCGHEGTSIERFLEHVLGEGLFRVIDIRRTAFSHSYGFSSGLLRTLCGRVGLECVTLPELGIPGALRQGLASRADRWALFRRYRQELLPRQPEAQARVAELVAGRPSVLVCLKADPADCHRGVLAPLLARRTGLPVRHLRAP